MILLDPKHHRRAYPDERSRQVMLRTIDFFERKGKRCLKADDHARVWYADFLDFVKREAIFATMCTPAGYGRPGSRWDTWRICEFAEILAFYGLQYWYTWQVSVLGLGPIWMSRNETVKRRAAQHLEDGGIFAFGLSEKEHGADVYATEMSLVPTGEGTYSARRRMYDRYVTAFPHVKRMLVDAYARLVAMKLVALRAADYMRVASADDRRYLLYNPVVKMKVTTQGEEVIDGLWNVIAAKGFEKDTYFEMAARDIRALPKLEGTVHVNIALIVKFIPGYFLNHAPYPPVGRRDEAANDDFLFDQGPARGLGQIAFHDHAPVFAAHEAPNVALFVEQIAAFRALMTEAPPDDAQRRDLDFLMALGEIFVLVVYAQLVLENARLYAVDDGLVDQIFDCLVRDVSRFALELHGN